jgi:Uma2 family endonuclease
MTTETRTKLTAAQFLELDLPPYSQLIDGEIVLTSPKPRHQLACARIVYALMSWTDSESGRGSAWLPLDVGIDERSVYVADVMWVSAAHALDLDRQLQPVPDLAIEVRSPSTWRYDIGVKKAGYERRGLPELWLVDTSAETVLVYRRATPKSPEFDMSLELTTDDTLTSPQLAGFELAVAELFAPPRAS